MSPTTQLQKPLGVVFGLLSVLKVRAMLNWNRLIGQSSLRATGRWWRLAVGIECQNDIPTAGGDHGAAARSFD
ncbi:hypothetical protein SE18_10845 [Herpetosiphon geysericola]|uniref:Uncharacterized protein n=1 Tax=Herpetosiphon geysericola TaxID=70996 RepID=A0A0P6YBL4_9CHLR|nr:hypothetical protein SE18_10845 [Herpetosiphon geysericola]